MFDPDLIDQLEPEYRAAVRTAVSILASSGIIDMQLARMQSQLEYGDIDEPLESVAQKVKDYRFKAAGLRSLKSFGESIITENTNEEES